MDTEQKIAVGQDILSYCGKCKLALEHVIVSMKNETTVGKCECKTCSATHLYKDPEAAAKKKTPKKVTLTNEELWKKALAKAEGTPKPYTMTGKFKVGNIIDHPTFGKGIVETVIGNNKIQTLFEDKSKLLIFAQ